MGSGSELIRMAIGQGSGGKNSERGCMISLMNTRRNADVGVSLTLPRHASQDAHRTARV
jgi:hypothetical protein